MGPHKNQYKQLNFNAGALKKTHSISVKIESILGCGIIVYRITQYGENMKYLDAVKTCFTKYIDIKGRASRSEYWWFVLFVFIVDFVAHLISPKLYTLAALIFLCPSITVMVRRLHDSDMSGWWALLCLIPLVNLIILYFMIIKGTEGPNRFGDVAV